LPIEPTFLTIFTLAPSFSDPFQLAFTKVEQLAFLLIAVLELIFAGRPFFPIRYLAIIVVKLLASVAIGLPLKQLALLLLPLLFRVPIIVKRIFLAFIHKHFLPLARIES